MSILFLLSAFASEVIGTVAGFGSSTIFFPLALIFVDFQTALVLVAFLHIFGNLGRISFFRHGMDKSLIIKFGIPSVIFTFLGAFLVAQISQDILKGVLGMFIICYASYSLCKKNFSVPPSTTNAVIGGGLSGFLAGLIGTGGALRGAFLTGFNLPKEKYIATSAAIALAVDITRIPVYIKEGFLIGEYYWYVPLLSLMAFAGSFTGKTIIKKIPQKHFRRFILVTLLLIGMKFIFDWMV